MPVTLGDKSDTSQFVFRKGESFTAVVYSNTAGTIRGNVRVVYDDGTEDDFKFNETSSGSSRAGVILTCAPHTTTRPGIVVSMFLGVSSAITQRGMCFAQVWMTNDPQSSGAISLLAQGYIYIGSPLILGVYIEPGPAGGPGAITRVTKVSTAIGTGLALASVAAGSIVRWIAAIGTLVASATAGTRAAAVRFRDASGNQFSTSGNLGNTANQTWRYEFGPNQTSDQTITLLGASGSVEFPSPDKGLPAGYDVFIKDDAAIDVADTATLEGQVEEWVVPN